MKILFTCPDTGTWPPKGWGAVEIVVYELSKQLADNPIIDTKVLPTQAIEVLIRELVLY